MPKYVDWLLLSRLPQATYHIYKSVYQHPESPLPCPEHAAHVYKKKQTQYRWLLHVTLTPRHNATTTTTIMIILIIIIKTLFDEKTILDKTTSLYYMFLKTNAICLIPVNKTVNTSSLNLNKVHIETEYYIAC